MNRRLLLATALIALFAAACAGKILAAPAPPPAPPPVEADAAPPASTIAFAEVVAESAVPVDAPCPGSGIPAGQTITRHLDHGGLVREYRVHVPTRAPAGPPPVVLNFHGRGGNAAKQEAESGLLAVSNREGFLLVSPEGTGSPRGWSAGASLPGWPVDDVGFTRALLDALERDFCNDPARVYATGFSNGAFFASRLACVMNDRIAAVAPVGGVHFPADACGRAVPLLAIHGVADMIVPFAAGRVRETFVYRGAQAETAAWAKHNGCGAATATTEAGATRLAYARCAAPTALIEATGVAHSWPAAAAEAAWAFFAAARLP